MNSAVVILSSHDAASADAASATVLTMPVARDRTSQVDFLRELSRARRSETPPNAVASDRADDAPVALRHEDTSVEPPWTDGFRSLPVGRTDAGIPDWAAASVAPSLNPDNWFTEPKPVSGSGPAADVTDEVPVTVDPEPQPVPEEIVDGADASNASPIATWWTNDPGPGLFDIAPELLSSPTLLVGPSDDPATDTPAEIAAAEALVEITAEPVTETIPGTVADSVTEPAATEPSTPVEGHTPPADPESESAPTSSRTLTSRPPALDPGAAVVVHCRGLAASRLTRGKSRPVLTGVDLDVRVGEVVVIGGRSGSGKTTLLECLAGLHPTESGELTVDGTSVRTTKEGGLAELRANAVGFVPQDSELLGDLSAIENIELPLLMHGWSPADARAEAEAAVSLLGLDRPAERPMDLSAGERRRVAIARAIVGEPTILWCDEPTAGLDPETAATIFELLFELCHDGLSIVAISHDPVLRAHATTSYELFDGSLRLVAR